jgi:hypothetical protein
MLKEELLTEITNYDYFSIVRKFLNSISCPFIEINFSGHRKGNVEGLPYCSSTYQTMANGTGENFYSCSLPVGSEIEYDGKKHVLIWNTYCSGDGNTFAVHRIVLVPSDWFSKTNQYNFEAILSTTILPLDGTYKIKTLDYIPNIQGCQNYIGHPATKEIVEKLGAVPAESKLFTGLEIGEIAVCFSIKQGQSDRSQGGTASNQEVDIENLSIRTILRVA